MEIGMDKKRLALKHFLRMWIVCTVLLFYALLIIALWIVFSPIVAIAVFVATFLICFFHALRFYNKLGELL